MTPSRVTVFRQMAGEHQALNSLVVRFVGLPQKNQRKWIKDARKAIRKGPAGIQAYVDKRA